MKSISVLVVLACGLLDIGGAVWPTAGSPQPHHAAAPSPMPAPIVQPARLDPYGGFQGLPAPGGATGFFRLEKIGPRWLLVTPEGNVFWMLAAYGLDITDGGTKYIETLKKKYKSPEGMPWWPFVSQGARRLRSWGFNALGEYCTYYALPVPTFNRSEVNPERMPFIRLIRPSWYGLTSGSFKDIIYGTDPAVYTGWRGGHFPDVFDPNFETFARKLATDEAREFTEPLTGSPWLIGTTTDDGDDTYGFGPGPGTNQDKVHEHLGWMVAATAPSQTQNRSVGAKYQDTVVYTKAAWRNHLVEKYETIANLNAAWGSNYTTFDSAGGWPKRKTSGTGLLDEDGSGPWMGKDFYTLSDTNENLRADMDDFLYKLADKYFSSVARAIRAYVPHHLVFTPAAINAGARPQILRAAGQHVDAIQVWVVPTTARTWLANAYQVSGRPVFVWSTFTSQADSALSATRGWGPAYDYATQEERGQAYQQYLQELLSVRAEDGAYPVLGIDWWAWTDKVTGGESMNFGLVSNLDNAYDGREAAMASGSDPWGYPVGGEKKNFGDFLSQVAAANAQIRATLEAELAGSETQFRQRSKKAAPPEPAKKRGKP